MAKLEEIKPTEKVDFSSFLKKSSDVILDKERVLLVGPPGHGKTTAAMTCSKYITEGFPLKKPGVPVALTDVYYVMLDNTGLDCIHGTGVYLPEGHVIDLQNVTGGALKKALVDTVDYLKPRVTKTDYVIVDSVTAIDAALSGWKSDIEGWGFMRAVGREHLDLFLKFRELPCWIIYTCHVKARYEASTADTPEAKQQKDTVKRASGAETAELIMALTGQTVTQQYRNNASFIIPTFALGSGSSRKFRFYPHGKFGIEAKNRFGRFLAEEEPAHLSEMFKKIRAVGENV